MEVPISLVLYDDLEMGLDEPQESETTLYFKDSTLDCFWIDPGKPKEIVFYVNGQSFRTPYNKSTAEKMYQILIK